MPNEIELIARLEAFRAGRAVPLATHRQIALQRDARILCPIALAGEDTSIHILACGTVGQARPAVWCVPDPRRRDDQYRLFEQLGAWLEPYFAACRREGTYPQIVVSSGAAIDHLDTLADRLRYNRENPAVRRLGELISYCTERWPIAGQQTLIAATDLLRRHWATGQQPGEDEHLGTLIAWIDPPAGTPIQAAVAAAEAIPMGVKTDPAFDRDTLEPLVTAYNQARRQEADQEAIRSLARQIRTALEPVVLRIYEATQRAVGMFRRLELPDLPDLAELSRRESDEFGAFLAARDAGIPLALRDRPRAAAFKFAEREDAVRGYGAAVLYGDRVRRAQALIDGHILAGQVENPRRIDAGPRQVEHTFDVVSTQTTLRVRPRDSFCWADDPRLRVMVVEVALEGGTTRVGLRVTDGQQAVGLPPAGGLIELVPGLPDWGSLGRTRKQLKKRLMETPWTHAEGGQPPAGPRRPAPADPLTAVEALE